MASVTETVIQQKSDEVASLIEGYNVYVCNDGSGPYISLNNPEDEEVYSVLSLTDEGECGDDLAKYRWTFWTGDHQFSADSELGYDASTDEVLHFLSEVTPEAERVQRNAKG